MENIYWIGIAYTILGCIGITISFYIIKNAIDLKRRHQFSKNMEKLNYLKI